MTGRSRLKNKGLEWAADLQGNADLWQVIRRKSEAVGT